MDRAKQALGHYLFRKLWKWIPGYGALEEAKLRFLQSFCYDRGYISIVGFFEISSMI